MNQDARRHARHQIEARADVLGTQAFVGLLLRDISVGGCCVQVPLTADKGQRIDLVVSFPTLDAHLSLVGTVIHVNAQRSGIRFELSSEDQRWALRNSIRQCLESAGEAASQSA